jgi:hypothetical protein
VSCTPGQELGVNALAQELGVPAWVVGTVGPARGELSITRGATRYAWPVESLRETYFGAIPRRMGHVIEDGQADGRTDGQ